MLTFTNSILVIEVPTIEPEEEAKYIRKALIEVMTLALRVDGNDLHACRESLQVLLNLMAALESGPSLMNLQDLPLQVYQKEADQ